jgi:hypothetical protein
MKTDASLRQHVLELLKGGHAHLDFDKAIAGLPANLRGEKPSGMPHTPWRLVEHMRIAQWDILQYSIDSKHISPEFPQGYWPRGDAPPSAAAWNQSVAAFRSDLQAMMDLVSNPQTDLFKPIGNDSSQNHTILREALLIADHNAYHLGQLVTIRRLLGAWHDEP